MAINYANESSLHLLTIEHLEPGDALELVTRVAGESGIVTLTNKQSAWTIEPADVPYATYATSDTSTNYHQSDWTPVAWTGASTTDRSIVREEDRDGSSSTTKRVIQASGFYGIYATLGMTSDTERTNLICRIRRTDPLSNATDYLVGEGKQGYIRRHNSNHTTASVHVNAVAYLRKGQTIEVVVKKEDAKTSAATQTLRSDACLWVVELLGGSADGTHGTQHYGGSSNSTRNGSTRVLEGDPDAAPHEQYVVRDQILFDRPLRDATWAHLQDAMGTYFAIDPRKGRSMHADGKTLLDLSGNGRHARLENGAYVDPVHGHIVLDYEAGDQWVSTSMNINLDDNRAYAFELWYWSDGPTFLTSYGNTALISNFGSESTGSFANIHILDDGKIDARESNSTSTTYIRPDTIYTDGRWHHIVKLTTASDNFTDGQQYMFVDGEQVGQSGRPGGVITSGQNIVIGGNHVGQFQKCRLGPVRIYVDYVPTPADIRARYLTEKPTLTSEFVTKAKKPYFEIDPRKAVSGSGLFKGQNKTSKAMRPYGRVGSTLLDIGSGSGGTATSGRNATLENGAFVDPEFGHIVLDHEAGDQWVSTTMAPNLDNNRPFAFECWLWKDESNIVNSYNTAIVTNYISTTTAHTGFHIDDEGHILVRERRSDGSENTDIVNDVNLVDSNWHHVVLVGRSVFDVFIDGVNVYTTGDRVGGTVTSGQNFAIGGNFNGLFQKCRIGPVRIWLDDATPTPAEIKARYESERLSPFMSNAFLSSGALDGAAAITGNRKPAIAYSLRKLYGSYWGPHVRVRRESDAAEADVYFDRDGKVTRISPINDPNGHDGTILLGRDGWAQNTDLRVLIWYDQSGHGHHMTPNSSAAGVTGASPPLLVDGGSVTAYALEFNRDTTHEALTCPTSVSGNVTFFGNFQFMRFVKSGTDGGKPEEGRVISFVDNNYTFGLHYGKRDVLLFGSNNPNWLSRDITSETDVDTTGGTAAFKQRRQLYALSVNPERIRYWRSNRSHIVVDGREPGSLYDSPSTAFGNPILGSDFTYEKFVHSRVGDFVAYDTDLDLPDIQNVENVLAENWLLEGHLPDHLRETTYECAFAFRKLFASYHDAQVKVKRVRDGALADLYFDKDGQLLDIFELTVSTESSSAMKGGDDWDGWLDGSAAELDTWYDQGSSGNDAIAFDAVKPRVVYKSDEAEFALKFAKNAEPGADNQGSGVATKNTISRGSIEPLHIVTDTRVTGAVEDGVMPFAISSAVPPTASRTERWERGWVNYSVIGKRPQLGARTRTTYEGTGDGNLMIYYDDDGIAANPVTFKDTTMTPGHLGFNMEDRYQWGGYMYGAHIIYSIN